MILFPDFALVKIVSIQSKFLSLIGGFFPRVFFFDYKKPYKISYRGVNNFLFFSFSNLFIVLTAFLNFGFYRQNPVLNRVNPVLNRQNPVPILWALTDKKKVLTPCFFNCLLIFNRLKLYSSVKTKKRTVYYDT